MIYSEKSVKDISDLRKLSLAQKEVIDIFNKLRIEGCFQSEENLREIQRFLVVEAGTDHIWKVIINLEPTQEFLPLK